MELTNQELIQKYNYKRLVMKDRDWELLQFVEEQGFASFGQLQKHFFNDKSNCSKRLNKLCAFRYLSRKKLYDFFVSPHEKGVKKGYFPHLLNMNITPQHWIYHIDRSYSKGFGMSQSLYKPSMILHQLILNEIRGFLEKEVIHKWSFNDPFLQVLSFIHFGRIEEIIPDLSIEDENIKIAIEVERTPKGQVRYFRRFNFFRQSLYTHIIYYYTDECQLKALLQRAGKDKKFAFAHYSRPDRLLSPVFGVVSVNEFIHRVLNRHYN